MAANDPPNRKPWRFKRIRAVTVRGALCDQPFMKEILNSGRVFRRMEPNDLAQDTYVRMLEKEEQYKGEPSLKAVKAWAYGISKNRYIDHIRKEKVRTDKTSLLKQTEQTGENVLQKLALKEAIDKLNHLQRQILQLYTDMHCSTSVEMIAIKLGLEKKRVYKELERIKRQLLSAIQELDI
jgi:RNA polymerase sigma factor (sigma-70 family)